MKILNLETDSLGPALKVTRDLKRYVRLHFSLFKHWLLRLYNEIHLTTLICLHVLLFYFQI